MNYPSQQWKANLPIPIRQGGNALRPAGWPCRCFTVGLAMLLCAAPVQAALVYDTAGEFFTSGDFDGDGRVDALVLDKPTGNVRVGYQNAGGALEWSPAFPTGVESASALAVGRFAQTNREAIAVSAVDFNRIHILNLSNHSNAPTPAVVNPTHAGVSLLVGLDAPLGAPAARSWLDVGAHDPGITLLDLFAFVGDGVASFQDQIAAEGPLGSAQSFRRSASDATLLAAMRRGSNDTFVAYAYTNTAAPVLVRSDLTTGTEYVFGRFNNEPYPRLLFYVPGESNIIVQPLLHNGTDFAFGAATSNSFAAAVERIFFVDEATNGLAVVHFGDGVVSGLRPPAGSGQLQVAQGFGVGPAGNVIRGVVALGIGKFALLSSASNAPFSTHAQVFTSNSNNYTQTSSNTLSGLTTAATRGNVWLFQAEPFTTSAAILVASLNAPVWSSTVLGLPGTISVRVESDAGVATGLGNPNTNNFGAPPGGTAYALPNQYREDISFFGYAPPRAAEASVVTISPPPGLYAGPIQISFSKQNAGDDVYYRRGPIEAWQFYFAPFALTNDTIIEYYGSNPGGLRGRTQLAGYSLGRTNLPPAEPVLDLDPGNTNQPPVIQPGTLISAGGTVFYSRADETIWAINLDGSGETYITAGSRPRVSRDGRWLAFLREGGGIIGAGNLWVRDLPTGQENRVFTNTDTIMACDWNGAQTELVFDNACGLWRKAFDAPALPLPIALTPECYNGAPVVNPADGRLAFHNVNPGGPQGVFVTPTDWSARTKLTEPTTLRLRWPGWSADGARLVMADRTSSAFINTGVNLWTASGDGSNLRQITSLTEPDGFPRGAIWSPDGRALIGAGGIGGTNGLWVIPVTVDGSACHCPPRRLPTSGGSDVDFAGSVIGETVRVTYLNLGLFIRLEPNALVVYWSTNYEGFALERAAALPAGLAWSSVSGPYFRAGSHFEYREPRTALSASRYFRLRYPGLLVLTPTEPELSFRAEGNQAVLSWPLNYFSHTLESTTNLSPPVLWTPLPGPYAGSNGVFEVQLNVTGRPQEFFRLRGQ